MAGRGDGEGSILSDGVGGAFWQVPADTRLAAEGANEKRLPEGVKRKRPPEGANEKGRPKARMKKAARRRPWLAIEMPSFQRL
jgi:hypothetical protein